MTDAPDPVDVHVGGRLRARRKSLGLSQERLAGELGLTFQQVQKYERGANRISASKLWACASALGVPIDFFFVGLEERDAALEASPQERAAHERRASFAVGVREAALIAPEIVKLPGLRPAARMAVRTLINELDATSGPHNSGLQQPATPAQRAPAESASPQLEEA